MPKQIPTITSTITVTDTIIVMPNGLIIAEYEQLLFAWSIRKKNSRSSRFEKISTNSAKIKLINPFM